MTFYTISAQGSDWRMERTISGAEEPVEMLATSADGLVVLSRRGDKLCVLQKDPYRFQDFGFDPPCKIACLNPDGSQLLTAQGKTVYLTNIFEPQERKLEVTTAPITTAKYAPDGRIFMAASEDQKVIIGDANTGMVLHTIEVLDGINSAQFDACGRIIIGTTNGKVIFYEPKQEEAVVAQAPPSRPRWWDFRRYMPEPAAVERISTGFGAMAFFGLLASVYFTESPAPNSAEVIIVVLE